MQRGKTIFVMASAAAMAVLSGLAYYYFHAAPSAPASVWRGER